MVEDNDETLPLPPPRPEHYMAPIIALHTRSMAFASQKKTEMKFGFNVDTHYGDLSQNNTWTSSWQEFFTDQMMDFLEREEMGRDIDPVRSEDRELLRLKPLFFDKVLPRYLGPLESGGREVVPCLLHADLWPWNVRHRRGGMGSDNSGRDGEEVEEKESMCLYDACVFWGHNEGKLTPFNWLSVPIHANIEKQEADQPNSSRPRPLPQPTTPAWTSLPGRILEARAHLGTERGRREQKFALPGAEPDLVVGLAS